MRRISVLGGCGKGEVGLEPFAHLVRRGVLDGGVYEELARGFPAYERFLRGGVRVSNNQALRIPASVVIGNVEFSELWRDFFAYHTSQAFWDEIVRVFGEAMVRRYPDIERRVGKGLEEWRSKLRGADGDAEVALDVLFVVNSPVEEASSVRPPHVDYEEKIFAGLFYMRDENEDAEGGDLALYRFRKGRGAFGGHYARERDLEECRVIPYEKNEFVAFVNAEDSLHGVTPRAITTKVRRYINFIAEVPFKAFSLPKLNPIQKFLFKLERRKKSRGVTLDY